jgi:hypothetical protein
MREDVVKFASSISVGVGMFVIYLVFLTRCIQLSDWSNLSQLEFTILVTQIIRVVIVFGLGKELRIEPLFAIILFSFEAFLIPFLAPLVILTNDPYYSTLMAAILTSWIGVSAIVLSPYVIYEFAKSLVKETSLPTVMLVATLEIGGMLFLSGTLANSNAVIRGPSALGTILLQLGRTQIFPSGFLGFGSGEIVTVGIVVFYIGMISYLSLGFPGIRSKIKISDAFLLPLIATVVVLVWIFGILSVSSNVLYVFTIPTLVGIVALWGSTRGS